jgi:hypothetical protein
MKTKTIPAPLAALVPARWQPHKLMNPLTGELESWSSVSLDKVHQRTDSYIYGWPDGWPKPWLPSEEEEGAPCQE